MKVSVSSYSFNRLIKAGVMTQKDTISKAAELRFDAIEFSELTPPEGVSLEDYARELREEIDRVRIPINGFAFWADFLNGSEGDTKKEIERVKKMVDIAEILGTPVLRHDATGGDGRPFDTVLPVLAAACREISEYAAKKGIKTTVENHGFFCQDSTRMEKLVAAVNHENFGLLADMGNFLCVDDDPALAVSRVAPYVFHVHAKDFYVRPAMGPDPGEGFFRSRSGNYLRGAIIGQGDVPVLHCLAALKKAEYDGYVAIEFEGIEDNIYGLKVGLANLRRYISML